MDGGFNLPAIGSIAPASRRIVGAVDLNQVAARVLHHVGTGHEIAVTQPDFAAWRETKVTLGRGFAKIILLDVEHSGKRYRASAGTCVFWVVDRFHLLSFVFWIIVDYELQRTQHGH